MRKYQVFDNKTGDMIFEGHTWDEAQEAGEHMSPDNFYINEVIPCRGCGNDHGDTRYDAHGISTGHWCYECFNSSKYPYRRDKYPTIETHGYGERLDDDY